MAVGSYPSTPLTSLLSRAMRQSPSTVPTSSGASSSLGEQLARERDQGVGGLLPVRLVARGEQDEREIAPLGVVEPLYVDFECRGEPDGVVNELVKWYPLITPFSRRSSRFLLSSRSPVRS